MATRTPILFPNNTAIPEIVGPNEEYGYMCKSGATINDWICLGAPDNNLLRPTTDALDMAEKMQYIKDHYDEARAKAELAYERVWTWEGVGEQWKDVFNKADIKKQILRGEIKPERNDPCPCMSNEKFKNCCGR
jgi:glycosyltransferase involved in cell wall biosynthesis